MGGIALRIAIIPSLLEGDCALFSSDAFEESFSDTPFANKCGRGDRDAAMLVAVEEGGMFSGTCPWCNSAAGRSLCWWCMSTRMSLLNRSRGKPLWRAPRYSAGMESDLS